MPAVELAVSSSHDRVPVAAAPLDEGAVASAVATDGWPAAEVNRWTVVLGVPFLLAAACFMLLLGTGQEWLIGAALALGPGLLIMAVIYLSLSCDTNRAA